MCQAELAAVCVIAGTYHPDNWVLDENSYYDKLVQAQADLVQKKEKEAKKLKLACDSMFIKNVLTK